MPKGNEQKVPMRTAFTVLMVCKALGELSADTQAITLIYGQPSAVVRAYGWLGLARGIPARLKRAE